MIKRFFGASLATKLVAAVFLVTALLLTTFAAGLSSYAHRVLQTNGIVQLQQQSRLVMTMIESYDSALQREAERLTKVFAADFEQPFALDRERIVMIGNQETPTLRAGTRILNQDLAATDTFAAQTGAVATVFARHGDDFVRIATSLKNDRGERAMGTLLDRTHPAYARLLAGDAYTGKATLFGRDYMTRYLPLMADGQPIGILFVGIDFSDELVMLKQQIRSLKIGETGYFYVLDAERGKNYGTLIVHPAKEGQNIREARDDSGRAFIQEMLERKEGVIQYPWRNSELNETAPRIKIAAYTQYPNWNWVIGCSAYLEEFSRDALTLRNAVLVVSGLLLLVVGGFCCC